ncbi:MAG: M56 family metallopeptidase [Tannerella sp.]|jgi:TonB family protein|nr:M56 family metallopeptidase [Tannerella sp.]
MGPFFAYSLQSAICLATFYLFYKVLLSRETFHRFNRIALLGVLALSFIIPPALTVFPVQPATAMTDIDILLSAEDDILSEKMNNTAGHTKNETGNILLSLLLITYLAGCVILLMRSVLQAIRIILIIRKGKCLKTGTGTTFIIPDNEKISPFSWMKHIVLSQSDYEEAGDTIIAHEIAHIRLHHTCDLIIAQVCLIMQWFNPAAWLLYRELQNIHEYEADEAVLHQGIDAKQYQLLLIKKAVGTRLYSMANSFTHSNLKKRITMMLQKKSNSWARLKYAYVLPLAVTTVAAFARPEISKQFKEISSAKVSHFAFTTGTNEVENAPETEIFLLQENIPEMEPAKNAADETPSDPANASPAGFNGNHSISNAGPPDSVYFKVEVMAEFPGGDEALLKWVSENMTYPENAAKKNIQGRVSCTFTVEKDGSVSDVHVVRPIHPELDAEAIRVLQKLPKFTPAKDKGEIVRVRYSVPVRFKLQATNNSNGAPPPPPPPTKAGDKKEESITDPNDPTLYIKAEHMPEFPGGDAALLKWISENIKYPENAKKNKIQGRVGCTFTVEKDGSVSDVHIVISVDPELDAEAVRALQTLPKFTPGKDKGEIVRVRYNVPVRFRMDPKLVNSPQ